MKNILFYLLAFLSLPALGQKKGKADTDPFSGLDKEIQQVLSDWKVAGAAVAVVEKDKVTYLKGFGYKNFENKEPVTPNTLFAIGSCTKAFTTTLLGILEHEGKISLNRPVNEYLPELKFYDDYLTTHVTTIDLMTHRTGLPRHDLSWYGAEVSRDSLLRRIKYLQPSAGLREVYQYNNFMFLVQGILAEKIESKPWEVLVKEKIFNPLGITNANFSVNDLQKAPDFSLGYAKMKDSIFRLPYMNIDPIGPAGSINASAAEMAKWAMVWANGGKLNGKEIIPASFYNKAITSHMAVNAGLPGKQNPDVHLSTIGLGWFLSSYKGHYRVEHGGNIDGFSATVSFFPSDTVGIVVLVNQNGSSATSIIRNMITDRVLKLHRTDWNKIQLDAIKEAEKNSAGVTNPDSLGRKTGTQPSHPIADYVGEYFHPGYGVIKIENIRDTLRLIYNSFRENVYLTHYHYDVFSVTLPDQEESTQKMKVQFLMNTRGEIDAMSAQFEAALDPVKFEKRSVEKPVTKQELERYTGEYEISGITIKVYIKGENTLMVLVPGQPDYELIPVGEHEFDFKTLKGFKLKFVLEKDKVTSMDFHQPNGVFKANKK